MSVSRRNLARSHATRTGNFHAPHVQILFFSFLFSSFLFLVLIHLYFIYVSFIVCYLSRSIGMSDELLELSIQGHGAESSSQNVTYQPTFLHYRRPLDRPMASMHKVLLFEEL